jgi:hypothetical protein
LLTLKRKLGLLHAVLGLYYGLKPSALLLIAGHMPKRHTQMTSPPMGGNSLIGLTFSALIRKGGCAKQRV